ncbi:MAG: sulfide/dihydroorotate dehydrogenase-like FAD/NAD-binding protein [Candidatus Cloacimonadota bacterium]|nr:MAG: sulfide/dihydroorotate dehydrogenase-like FAD/NAD-binding protein [Candidatus Cloacimonadota bacterium]
MNKIVKKQKLADGINLFEIEAALIARKRKPGQFVILRLDETGERIPLTIADVNREKGTVTIIVQVVGKTTEQLGTLGEGNSILDVVGPLGQPTYIKKFGTVVAVGGGVGHAVCYPIARGMKDAGNYLISIIGARNKKLVILEEETKSFSDELYITTDDGSYGRKGFVTDQLKEIIESGKKVDLVLASGPAIMMKFVSLMTKEYRIKTIVSLNSIMIDGTGMCGVCRVEVGGKTKFACVDGPEFDGHEVNYDLLMKRLASYKEEEKLAHECYLKTMANSEPIN